MIKSKDLLIDLVLIGTGDRPLIKTIKVIPFDVKTGALVDELELHVSKRNCLSVFTRFDPEFLEYLLNGEIKDNSNSGDLVLNVLQNLNDFCTEHIDENTKIWSTKRNFKIIHDLYNSVQFDTKLKWNSSNELDVDTMLFLSNKIKVTNKFPDGNPLKTISILSQIFNKL